MEFGKPNKNKIVEKIALKNFGIINTSNLPKQARDVNQGHIVVLLLRQSYLNAA